MFIRLPFVTPPAGIGAIDPDDMTPIGPELPQAVGGSYAHWSFGEHDGSLISIVGGKVLTPQAGSHSWFSNYVSLPGGAGNGLLTDLPDAAAQGYMVAAKLMTPSVGAGPVMAGSWSGSPPNRRGSALYFVSSNGQVQVIVETALPQTGARLTPSGHTPGDWVIFGLFENLGGANRTVTSYVRNAGNGPPNWFHHTATAAKSPIDATKMIAAGNAYIGVFSANATELSEFVVWDRYPTTSEMDNAANVLVRNCALKGITVK